MLHAMSVHLYTLQLTWSVTVSTVTELLLIDASTRWHTSRTRQEVFSTVPTDETNSQMELVVERDELLLERDAIAICPLATGLAQLLSHIRVPEEGI